MSIIHRTLLSALAGLFVSQAALAANTVESQIELALDCAETGGAASGCPKGKDTEDLLDYALDTLERAYSDEERTAEFLARIAKGFHDLGSCSQATQVYEQYLEANGQQRYKANQAAWLIAYENAVTYGDTGGQFANAYSKAPEFLKCFADYMRRNTSESEIAKLGQSMGRDLTQSERAAFGDYYSGKGGVHAEFWNKLSYYFHDEPPPPHVVDADGDGAPSDVDCDDNDPQRYPGAPDRHGDGIDQDCDRTDGVDVDQDGHASIDSGGFDCNDLEENVFPKNRKDKVRGGVDNNCDGVPGIDHDRDGLASRDSGGKDCNDLDDKIKARCPDDDDDTAGTGVAPYTGEGPGFRLGALAYLTPDFYPGGLLELYYGIDLGGSAALRLGAEYRADYAQWTEDHGSWIAWSDGDDHERDYLENALEGQATLLAILRGEDSMAIVLGGGAGIGLSYLADLRGQQYWQVDSESTDTGQSAGSQGEGTYALYVDALVSCFSGHGILGVAPQTANGHRMSIELDLTFRHCSALEPNHKNAFGLGLTIGAQ